MVKGLTCAGLVLMAMSMPSAAETNFRGNLVFTAVKNCNAKDAQAGWEFKSSYHVPMSGNDNFSGLSLVYQYGAIGHRLENAKFTSAYKVVKTGGVGWGDAYTSKRQSSILVSLQVPSTLTPTTPSVIVTGKIKNVWGDIGVENCEVTFRGVYVRNLN
jgi:hypothetical protein